MKNRSIIISTALLISLSFFVASSVSAATKITKTAKTATAKVQKQDTNIQDNSNKEIDSRIADLQKLSTRVQSFKNTSDADKASLVSSINTLVSDLTNLKSEVNATTSATVLKGYKESIAKDYRIYALAIPEINIIAAGDRVITMTSMLSIVGSKLDSRLSSSSQINAKDLTSLQASLADFKAKAIDAGTQANIAMNSVKNLLPDQGDKTVLASNTAALKDARSKIKIAQNDLLTAHKDAQTIIKTLGKSDSSTKTATSTSSTK